MWGTASLSLKLNRVRRRVDNSAHRFTAKPILRSTSFRIFMIGSRIRFLASAFAPRILLQFSLISSSSQNSDGCFGLKPAVDRIRASIVTVFPSLCKTIYELSSGAIRLLLTQARRPGFLLARRRRLRSHFQAAASSLRSSVGAGIDGMCSPLRKRCKIALE